MTGGLAHSNAGIRNDFLAAWEAGVGRTPFQRLFFIVTAANFEPMAQHYWLKQCIHVGLWFIIFRIHLFTAAC